MRRERLQDISSEDTKAEGSYLIKCDCSIHKSTKVAFGKVFPQQCCPEHGVEFSYLWDAHHEKSEHRWAANPWVAVNTFKRIQL